VRQCVVCKQFIGKTYYHAQGAVVCELCAQRIQNLGTRGKPPRALQPDENDKQREETADSAGKAEKWRCGR